MPTADDRATDVDAAREASIANPASRLSARRAGLRGFFALFGAGVVGVIAAVPVIVPLIEDVLAGLPEVPEMPFAGVVALALVNPLLLLAVATLVGVLVAPRIGLRSGIAERAAGARLGVGQILRWWPLAVLVGSGVGIALVVLDALSQPLLGPAAGDLALLDGRTLSVTVAGIFYGGITEEIMLRWGLMALLAWGAWRVAGRGSPRPSPALMWGAIVVSAVAFGLLHLPAVGAITDITLPVIVRTVVLNALGGVAFGWLFWRRNLETAMLAHAMAHVAMTVIAVALGG